MNSKFKTTDQLLAEEEKLLALLDKLKNHKKVMRENLIKAKKSLLIVQAELNRRS